MWGRGWEWAVGSWEIGDGFNRQVAKFGETLPHPDPLPSFQRSGAAQGGKVNTALKNEAQDAMVSALRQTAAYVQSLVPTLTLSQVLTSGFDVANSNTTPSPLAQPVFTLDNSSTMQLAVVLSPSLVCTPRISPKLRTRICAALSIF